MGAYTCCICQEGKCHHSAGYNVISQIGGETEACCDDCYDNLWTEGGEDK
jgi:collagenase-like PrtC family protease